MAYRRRRSFYAAERIFMRRHDMWVSDLEPVVGLSDVFDPVASRLCRTVEVGFREFPFHAIR